MNAISKIKLNGTTYQLGMDANSTTAGIMKLYSELGSNTDGAVTQAALNTAMSNIASAASADIQAEATRATAAEGALADKIGTVPADKTLVDMISEVSSSASGDSTAIAGRVDNLEDAVELLNKTDGTAGSVKKTVDDAIAAVIADAPASFDTLKEISDWISTHVDSASTMNTAITKAQSDIDNHKADKNNPHEVTAAQIGVSMTIDPVDTTMLVLTDRISA